jgi:hypothetical protein
LGIANNDAVEHHAGVEPGGRRRGVERQDHQGNRPFEQLLEEPGGAVAALDADAANPAGGIVELALPQEGGNHRVDLPEPR